MSRHRIDGLKPGHEVYVGWDDPLQSYFGQVYAPGVRDREGPIHWVGASPPWLREVSYLVTAMRPYAEVSTAIQRTLFADREFGR